MERRFHFYRYRPPRSELPRVPRSALESALAGVFTLDDLSLAELARRRIMLLVLLPDGDCPACREAVSDLAFRRATIESLGIAPVVSSEECNEVLAGLLVRYGLADLMRIPDRMQRLAAALQPPYGRGWQVIGPKRIWRGANVALVSHRDALPPAAFKQLPGAFLAHQFRQIIR